MEAETRELWVIRRDADMYFSDKNWWTTDISSSRFFKTKLEAERTLKQAMSAAKSTIEVLQIRLTFDKQSQ